MAAEERKREASVRGEALNTLLAVMEDGVFCDKAVHKALKECHFESRDRKIFTRLVEGTVERCIELDYILNRFTKIKVKKMKPVIRNILRLSLYQILYMDQIGDFAACNEAVRLTEKRKLHGLKGFVNGVLRNIVRQKEKLPYPERSEIFTYLSIHYSEPEWLVRYFVKSYGEAATEEIFKAFFKEEKLLPVRFEQSNVSAEQFEASLLQDGVRFWKGRLFPYAYYLELPCGLEELESFKKGFFSVQDESSMLPGALAGVKEGDFVIDICAAPGGKSMHLDDVMHHCGTVVSADLTEKKVSLIRENAERLHAASVIPVVNDAKVFREEWKEKADVVIADLPCSGLGVIGKKCDIKYKTKEEDIGVLAALQREILKIAVCYLKPGGRLIYSTCTLTSEENEENRHFIERELSLFPVSVEAELPVCLQGKTGKDGYIQVMPNETGTDGFFVSVFEKGA